MRSFLFFVRTAIAFFMLSVIAGCSKYDDSEVRNQLKDHEGRLLSLEDAIEALDSRAGAMIKSVTAITGGWRIEFTSGTPTSIDVMNNATSTNPDPSDGGTLEIDVRTAENGAVTIWYRTKDGEWIDTGEDIRGPKGEPGDEGEPGNEGEEGDDGGAGDDGERGPAGISPKVRVKDNGDGTVTIQYNATLGYPDENWITAGDPIALDSNPNDKEAIFSIVDNEANGTVTITMNNSDVPADRKVYEFAKFSTAQHFEIMDITLNFAEVGKTKASVLFRVNPSNATVLTEKSKWQLDQVSTRASYVSETTAFSLQSIAKDSDKKGQYEAIIVYEDYDPTVEEYVLALVYNNGTDAKTGDPILITSAPFSLKEVAAPTITKVEENGSITITHNEPLVVNRTITLTATPETDYIFSKWEFKLDGAPLAYEDLNGRDQNKNVNSSAIEFWMPNGKLEVKAVFVAASTAFTIDTTENDHGTLTVATGAASETNVSLSATAEDGWYVKGYTVTGATSNEEYEVTIANDKNNVTNRATFTMKNENVKVQAIYGALAAESSAGFATINGVKWAKYNVNEPKKFATAPEDFGAFFQFGIGDVAWSTVKEKITIPKTDPVSLSPANAVWNEDVEETGDWVMSNTDIDDTDDVSNPCPEGYVVPDEDTALSLLDREAVSISAVTVNSVSGYRFVDRASGEYIFLPGASHRNDNGGVANSTNGWYWTTTSGIDGPGKGYISCIYFYDKSVERGTGRASQAKSVRCVQAMSK